MKSWDHLRCFALAVHRGRSYAAAARALDVELSTVTRRIAALEEEVGARLFFRTSRGLVPTQAGTALVGAAEKMEAQMLALGRALASDSAPRGVVRLATTDGLAERLLVDGATQLAERLGAIELELVLGNARVDLARDEADLALRLVAPREPDLVARRVASFGYAAYASRAYVDARGIPTDGDLRGHDVILGSRELGASDEWAWIASAAESARVAIRTTSSVTVRVAIEAGLGIGILPHAIAASRPRGDLLGEAPR